MIKNNTPFNILVSFAFANRQMMQVCRKYVEEKKINLMIDSGAFTAFNHNKKGITLDAYCNFLKEQGDICEKYVMLDVIGNKEASIVNYEKMLAKGLAPMYTATIYDNDFDYIGKTLDICPDICVAGGATSNGEWIRKRYCEVYEKTGRKARIHALGFVKNPDMFRLPIVSVDSSSFNCGRRYGYFSYFSLSEKKVKVVPKTSMNFPIEARLKFIECGMTPEILKKYDTSGANAIELSGIVAYTEYQMYCYANKRELFISVPNAEQLEQIVWVYNNLGNIDYLEYRKRFRK